MLARVERMRNYLTFSDLKNLYPHFLYIGPANPLLGLPPSDLDLKGLSLAEFRQQLWQQMQRKDLKILSTLRRIDHNTTLLCWDVAHGELIARAAHWLADKELAGSETEGRGLPLPNAPAPAAPEPTKPIWQQGKPRRPHQGRHRVILAGEVYEK